MFQGLVLVAACLFILAGLPLSLCWLAVLPMCLAGVVTAAADLVVSDPGPGTAGVWVAVTDTGQVVARVLSQPGRAKGRQARLSGLFVCRAWRGRGLAPGLLRVILLNVNLT